MELTNSFSAVALAGVVGKLAYSHARKWWHQRTLKERYIAAAAVIQNEHEAVTTAESFDDSTCVEELITTGAIGRAVRKKAQFRNYLVQQGQAKFGCPQRNEANRLVVRKYLHDVCVDRGLIARHINDHLDIATELVFVPSRNQLLALALSQTELTKTRHGVRDDLGGPRATLA